MKYEVTDTKPQDCQRRTLRNPMEFKLRQSRPAEQELLQAGQEMIRGYLAELGALGRGRLTACGTVSTGGGGANVAVAGRGLIPAGWRQARCQIDVAGDNNDLIWECIAPGSEGNGIVVQYVDSVLGTVVWDPVTRIVTCNIDVTGAGMTVANLLIALAASATGAQYVVQARNAWGSTGAGTIDAIATATMAGGTGTCMNRLVLTTVQGANRDLTFESVDYGPDCKAISMSYTDTGAGALAPAVAVTEAAALVTIDVACNFGGAAYTALAVLQALRDSADAMAWIHVRLADGSNGTGLPAAMAATALAVPFGTDGFDARIGPLQANIQTLTDDGLTFDCAAAVGAAGETVEFVARIAGIEHRITAAVVA